MNDYDWFVIYSLAEFTASELTSKELTLILTGYGQKVISLYKGVGYSVKIDDVFLRINLNDKNPFYFEDRAVAIDEDGMIVVGILRED